MLEELLTAEELEVRVLDPTLAQDLIGEVVQVLEDRQACHEAGRQRRSARIIVVDGSEALLKKAPVYGGSELHQGMGGIDDLVEPGTEQIRLTYLPPLLGPHENPRDTVDGSMESQPAAPIKLPENASTERSNWQTRILAECRNPSLLRGLGVLHGRLAKEPSGMDRDHRDWALLYAIPDKKI